MKEKLSYLEGLRGLAALMVVFKHLQLTIAPRVLENLELMLDGPGWSLLRHVVLGAIYALLNAELAVYLFWFLSAYVISMRLFTREDPNYLISAFSKRYFRLAIPVGFSILMAFGFMASDWMFNQQLAQATGNEWLAGYYAFDTDLFGALKLGFWGIFFRDQNPVYNPVLWTIYPEFIGSLICFALFGIFGRHPRMLWIAFVFVAVGLLLNLYWSVTFVLGYIWSAINFNPSLQHPKKRLLGIFQYQRLNLWILVLLLIVSGIYDYYFGGQYGRYWLFHVVASTGMIMIITQTVSLQKALAGHIYVWLGRISFGLYVVHFPILCSFSSWLMITLPLEGTSLYLVSIILSLGCCLIVATLFTRFIDSPSLKLANKLGRLASASN